MKMWESKAFGLRKLGKNEGQSGGRQVNPGPARRPGATGTRHDEARTQWWKKKLGREDKRGGPACDCVGNSFVLPGT